MQSNSRMNSKKVVRVRDLMSTAIVSVKETDIVGLAKAEMDFAAIRHLPVVDAEGRLAGVISQRDVLQTLAKRDGKPVHAGEIMIREVRAVRPEAPAYEAARAMLDAKIGSMPVVSERGELVGILTESDFVQIAEEALRDQATRSPTTRTSAKKKVAKAAKKKAAKPGARRGR